MSGAGAWSYSKMSSFETCPKQYYHVTVLKEHSFKETKETRYGNEFHKAAEQFIRDGTPLPGKFSQYGKAMDAIAALPGEKHCELKLGVTEDLKPCKFFGRNVWLRAIVDFLSIDGDTAYVVDYKTGKSARYADPDQLELMALAAFVHYPQVKKVKAGLLFVVAGAFIKEVYDADSREMRWSDWYQRYADLEKAHRNEVFNPRPSGLCRAHCPVLECPHNGRG